MVLLKCNETGRFNWLSNEEVFRLSDCVLAQMESYNKALDLCTDKEVKESIQRAKKRLQHLNTVLMRLLPEDL